MKVLKYFSLCACMLALSLCLVACGGKKDENPTPPPAENYAITVSAQANGEPLTIAKITENNYEIVSNNLYKASDALFDYFLLDFGDNDISSIANNTQVEYKIYVCAESTFDLNINSNPITLPSSSLNDYGLDVYNLSYTVTANTTFEIDGSSLSPMM